MQEQILRGQGVIAMSTLSSSVNCLMTCIHGLLIFEVQHIELGNSGGKFSKYRPGGYQTPSRLDTGCLDLWHFPWVFSVSPEECQAGRPAFK
jgi:hypothetical protein